MAIRQNPLSDRGAAASEPPISYLMQHALANPNIISLAAGFVDQQTLPVDICREAIGHILAEPEAGCEALQYGTTKGHPPLREFVLARLAEADRAAGQELQQANADHVLVSAGSNQLLHLISECLLNPGDIVICAAPSYFVYLGLLQNLNVRAVGVPTDDRGIDVAALDATLSRLNDQGELPRVKMVYLVTYFDNPHGTTLARDRRPAVLDVVEKWSRNQHIYIVEDAAYRELVERRLSAQGTLPANFGELDADHPVDLIVGGAADQKLRMLHRGVNRSVGASLRTAAEAANLQPGDRIRSITVN